MIQRSKDTLQPSALQLCGSSWFLCTTSARQRVIFPIPKNSAVFREAVFRALLRLRQWQEAALSCTATKRSSSPCPHGTVIQGEELTGLAGLWGFCLISCGEGCSQALLLVQGKDDEIEIVLSALSWKIHQWSMSNETAILHSFCGSRVVKPSQYLLSGLALTTFGISHV